MTEKLYAGLPAEMRIDELEEAVKFLEQDNADLGAEREALRQRCEGQLGPSPAAVLLRMFDAEIARRREGGRP
jgi:hypothetical protein